MRDTHQLLRLTLAIAATACAAGGGVSRVVPVRPCPVADSLLGQRSRDRRHALSGHVYELTGTPGLMLSGRFETTGTPFRAQGRVDPKYSTAPGKPGTILEVYVRGELARAVQRFGRPLGGLLVLDDSLTYSLGTGTAGTYEGPAYLTTLMISFRMPSQAFRALARANAATVLLTLDGPPSRFRVAEEDRRDIAALYIVSACGAHVDTSRPPD